MVPTAAAPSGGGSLFGSRLTSGVAAKVMEEGDRVAILLPNGLEAIACHLACFRMWLVIVPLDCTLPVVFRES